MGVRSENWRVRVRRTRGCDAGELESVRFESWRARGRRVGGCEVGELEDAESVSARGWR